MAVAVSHPASPGLRNPITVLIAVVVAAAVTIGGYTVLDGSSEPAAQVSTVSEVGAVAQSPVSRYATENGLTGLSPASLGAVGVDPTQYADWYRLNSLARATGGAVSATERTFTLDEVLSMSLADLPTANAQSVDAAGQADTLGRILGEEFTGLPSVTGTQTTSAISSSKMVQDAIDEALAAHRSGSGDNTTPCPQRCN